jgi:hypothetical protein
MRRPSSASIWARADRIASWNARSGASLDARSPSPQAWRVDRRLLRKSALSIAWPTPSASLRRAMVWWCRRSCRVVNGTRSS